MKYRRKVGQEVEAHQIAVKGTSLNKVHVYPLWLSRNIKKPSSTDVKYTIGDIFFNNETKKWELKTSMSDKVLNNGDYVVKNEYGQMWVYSEEVFKEIFQKSWFTDKPSKPYDCPKENATGHCFNTERDRKTCEECKW